MSQGEMVIGAPSGSILGDQRIRQSSARSTYLVVASPSQRTGAYFGHTRAQLVSRELKRIFLILKYITHIFQS